MNSHADVKSAGADQTNSANAKPMVLVVDDDRITHGIVRKFIVQAGLEYIAAFDTHEATQTLIERTPDLILCDIQMPGEDGITFCSRLRENDATHDIPVIFFTGSSDAETMSLAFEAGANDYVIKPIRGPELISRAKRQIIDYRRKKEAASKIQLLNKQNESKTKFLGIASHDLRNPLVSIRGISQFLESEKFGELNEGQKEMIHTIIDASESMLTLVEDLLDVSKIELDKFDIQGQESSPASLMELASKLHQPTASRKSITIKHKDNSEGALAILDRKLVSRVIDNLTTNAIKFSPSETHVTLETRLDGEWIEMIVSDQGPGIPESEFDKLFKEFSRTSNLPTAGESTSGIGLYVVKRIVISHGGEVLVENKPEGGAKFTVKFKRIQ